jgi:Leucine-rich repeat (LRR) protein
VLNLGHNKLKKVDINMLRGLRLLRRLLINDNEITHVERGTFEAVSRIGTIDLSGNRITKIDYQMFNELRNVEVDFTMMATYSVIEIG